MKSIKKKRASVILNNGSDGDKPTSAIVSSSYDQTNQIPCDYQNSYSTSSFSSSSDTEEFASNMHNIDNSIYNNCKRSKLKIIYMNKNDLRKWRDNQNNTTEHKKTISNNNETIDKNKNNNNDRSNITNKTPRNSMKIRSGSSKILY